MPYFSFRIGPMPWENDCGYLANIGSCWLLGGRPPRGVTDILSLYLWNLIADRNFGQFDRLARPCAASLRNSGRAGCGVPWAAPASPESRIPNPAFRIPNPQSRIPCPTGAGGDRSSAIHANSVSPARKRRAALALCQPAARQARMTTGASHRVR